ncbi:MAG: hypothetical protein KDB61_04055 [Planctomycetes bacterium]|nr:hypothetical protein [Planctomycetota bacterium]
MSSELNANHRMRRRALDVNRAFLKMRPIFLHARRLSLNAEVTSSIVGESGEGLIIVMRELRTMTGHLKDMVEEIEGVSGRVANRMASSMSAEARQHYYRDTLNLIRVDQGKETLNWAATGDAAPSKPLDLNATELRLWNAVQTADHQIAESLDALEGISQELLVLLNRSGWVAVRQSEYLSVLTAVEASRWTERRESVEAIVESMRDISEQLRVIQKEASDQVNGLIHEIRKIQSPQTKALAAKAA